MESFSDHENEIKLLLEEMAKNPKSKAFIRLGNIYIKLEMYNEAMDVVKEGLRYSPDNVSGLVILAKCQREKKNLLEAVKLFEKVLSIDPQHIVSMLALGEIKKRQGDLERAYKLFDNVLFLDPSNEDVKKELKVIKRQIDEMAAEKERIALMKKRLDEQSQTTEIEKSEGEEKKYVDDFIIQHSSSVINFDEDDKKGDAEEKAEEKKAKKESSKEEEKTSGKNEEKSSESGEKIKEEEKDRSESEESRTEMLDESAYINPEVDPYIEKEKKQDENFIPYELPGEKKFMFYSQEMAVIYAEQEQYEKAVEVYQMILRQNPQDEEIAEKIRELRELMAKREFNLEAFKEKEEKKKQSRTEFIDRLNQSLSVEDATEDELKKAESKFGIEGDSASESDEKPADRNEMTDEERALMEKYGSVKSEDSSDAREEEENSKKEKEAAEAAEKEEKAEKERLEKEKKQKEKREKEEKAAAERKKEKAKAFADMDRIKDIPNIPKAAKKNEEEAEAEDDKAKNGNEGTPGGKQDFSEWLKNVNKFNKDKK